MPPPESAPFCAPSKPLGYILTRDRANSFSRSYTDAQLSGNKVVKPDQSYTPANLP